MIPNRFSEEFLKEFFIIASIRCGALVDVCNLLKLYKVQGSLHNIYVKVIIFTDREKRKKINMAESELKEFT